MSSVLEKTASTISLVEKRSFLLRTTSIQKIKCSATYPFRLAGTKFNRDAIKNLFETLIIKARIISQKIVNDLLLATFKLVNLLTTIWVGVPVNSVCKNTEKTDNVLGFHERLLNIHKLRQHKNSSLSSETSPLSLLENNGNDTNFQNYNVEKLRKINANDQMKMINSNLQKNNDKIDDDPKKNNNFLLVLLVHSSTAFIYLQLLILTLALNSTYIPPGLLFLISSLVLIAVIVFKIFLIEKQTDCETKSTVKQTGKSESNDNTSEEQNTSSSINFNSRQMRSKYRKIPRMIDLNSKTISKIKIL